MKYSESTRNHPVCGAPLMHLCVRPITVLTDLSDQANCR